VRACFDTNILIDLLNGVLAARRSVREYESRFVSIVTLIEVLSGGTTPEMERTARRLLGRFSVVEVDTSVAELAVTVRRTTRLRMPDAIVLATAKHLECQLLTRDGDFPADDPTIRVPYEV
jgi:predicted nucleic acid-binding protein